MGRIADLYARAIHGRRRTAAPRLPEESLPARTRQALAGSSGLVLLAYLATLPDRPGIMGLAHVCAAAVFAAVAVHARHRTGMVIGAGVGAVGVLMDTLLRILSPTESETMLLPMLFWGVVYGTTAGSSVRTMLGWLWTVPRRVGAWQFWAGSIAVLAAIIMAPETSAAAWVTKTAQTSRLLLAVLGLSIVGVSCMLLAGWVIGRGVRMLLDRADGTGDRVAWQQWEALYRI